MVSLAELETMLQERESDRVEKTISTTNVEKFCEAICAFSNDYPNSGRPGYLIVGARDDGSLSGLQVTEALLQTLAAIRTEGNIVPMPQMEVRKYSFDAGEVAVVRVLPSSLPPVRYKGRAFIRVGPRRAIATFEEERRLAERRIAHARTFDALPCLGSGLGDLDEGTFLGSYLPLAVGDEVARRNGRSLEMKLSALHLFDLASNCPTNAGILLFGVDPCRFLPGAYLQFLHVRGERLTDPVENEYVIRTGLVQGLRDLDATARVLAGRQPRFVTALREESIERFPYLAVRELVVNAVIHRSYESTAPVRVVVFSDRLEIQSPGGLFGESTPSNFPWQTSYRNPILASAAKTLGYVNRFGRGVLAAQEALRANGSDEASFEFRPEYVRCSIPRLSGI